VQEISRRSFLKTGSAALAAFGMGGTKLFANPLGLPIGLQLYSVRALLPKDFEGTLKQLSAIGYKEVEAAGFFDHSAEDVKKAMSNAGLRCISAHYPMPVLQKDPEGTLQYAKTLGLEYIVCSSPSVADPSAGRHELTADDWHWNAEQLNRFGKQFKAEGIRMGYHNHTPEFRDLGEGKIGYDVLLKDTDPALVTFEMDCAWVVAGGRNPVDYLHQYPNRISMLHVKDLKPVSGNSTERTSTVLGKGTIDYKPIFTAAKKANIKHYFVEQEEFDGDPLEELRQDYQYLHALR
jgi:sugar phosphate isomerase/epimerase